MTGKEVKYHKCWHSKCPSCKQCVDLKNHKCFIEVIKEETEDVSSTGEEEVEEKRKKKSLKGKFRVQKNKE